MNTIVNIKGYEVLDSRGNPTVEAEVFLDSGISARGIVPSGASTGKFEAVELRDKDPKRYNGKGVLKSIYFIENEILETLIGMNVTDQVAVDETLCKLDGSKNKSRLGANTILSVSLAVARCAAIALDLPLYKYLSGMSRLVIPVPFMNVINGGSHANNNLDIQEFMIVPHGFKTFKESLRCGVEIFHNLKEIINSKNMSTTVGDEGGFAPNLNSNEEALDLIISAIKKSKYKLKDQVSLALDCASSEFYKKGKYNLSSEEKILNSQELITYLEQLVSSYPIISIEDPLAENDWKGWEKISFSLGDKIQLVGDDLFVTNTEILKKGIQKKVANSVLIKINQIGTLTETIDTIQLAQENKYKTMISHRSGETEDNFIADLAVATKAGQIKTGSLSRSDRLAKYNQLLRIEKCLGESALFYGSNIIKF